MKRIIIIAIAIGISLLQGCKKEPLVPPGGGGGTVTFTCGPMSYIITSAPVSVRFDIGPASANMGDYTGKANNFLIWEVAECAEGDLIDGLRYCYKNGTPVKNSGNYNPWTVPAGAIWRAGRFQGDGYDYLNFHFSGATDTRFVLGYMPLGGYSIGWKAVINGQTSKNDGSCKTNPAQGSDNYGRPKCIDDMQLDPHFYPTTLTANKKYLARLMSAGLADSTSPSFKGVMSCYQVVFSAP